MFKRVKKFFYLYILRRKYYRVGSCNACGRCCQKIYVKHKNVIQTEEEFKKLQYLHPFYTYLKVIDKDETPSVLKAAWLIALVTIASKFMGFVRDMVVANFYGATMVSDAYFYALQIPSLAIIILGGVGGPFHSAAVAVFSKLIPDFNSKPDETVNKLYNTFLTVSFLFFALLSVIGFFFADKIMGIIISAGSPELVALASAHFKIMSPVILFGGIIGIYYGLLVCCNDQ